MASWYDVSAAAPELMALVQTAFERAKHCTLATLRADGSPRISGSEVELRDGQMWLGSMLGAVKARDLQRDGRFALHSATVDPPAADPSSWAGEAKVAGRAVEVPGGDAHRFRLDLTEVVLTRVSGDRLEITSWHEGRGVEVRHR